jgi:predicted RNase H-like HicB family nuclease
MAKKRKSREEYLEEIEEAAQMLVEAACEEDSFEVFLDDNNKTDLQHAITDLARKLRIKHYQGDGCLDH